MPYIKLTIAELRFRRLWLEPGSREISIPVARCLNRECGIKPLVLVLHPGVLPGSGAGWCKACGARTAKDIVEIQEDSNGK